MLRDMSVENKSRKTGTRESDKNPLKKINVNPPVRPKTASNAAESVPNLPTSRPNSQPGDRPASRILPPVQRAKKLSLVEKKPTGVETRAPFSRYGKAKKTLSNHSVSVNPAHKIGELPQYLKRIMNKNGTLLARTKRDYENERQRLCEAQTRIIALQKTYQQLQQGSKLQPDEHIDELKLIAIKYNNDSIFHILTKSQMNQENIQSFTDVFFKEIMTIISDKCNNPIELNLQIHTDTILEIITILNSVQIANDYPEESEKLRMARAKLLKLNNICNLKKQEVKNQCATIVCQIRDLIAKKNKDIEEFLTNEKSILESRCTDIEFQMKTKAKLEKENFDKQMAKLQQELDLKALEIELKDKTVEELKRDLYSLENKMELFSSNVNQLKNKAAKKESEKDLQIEHLEKLLSSVKIEKSEQKIFPAVNEEIKNLEEQNTRLKCNIGQLKKNNSDMQLKITKLENEREQVLPSFFNEIGASAEELQNLFSTLGSKQIELSRQTRIIEMLERYNAKLKLVRVQQGKTIAKLKAENEQLKIRMKVDAARDTQATENKPKMLPVCSSSVTAVLYHQQGKKNEFEQTFSDTHLVGEKKKTEEDIQDNATYIVKSTKTSAADGNSVSKAEKQDISNSDLDSIPGVPPAERFATRNMNIVVTKYSL